MCIRDSEGDQRHAEQVVEELELRGCKPVVTPGTKEGKEGEGEPLSDAQATMFRKIAARCAYLSSDRPDIVYSAKELCRKFAAPTTGSWEALKRMGRYLAGRPRLVMRYPWQDQCTLQVWGGQ